MFKITSGASDDLQKVTKMAKAIVSSYGMSKLGYRVYEVSQESFSKNYSEETDRQIDDEVHSIIEECSKRTREIVDQYKEEIKKISIELLSKETIDVLDIIKLIGDRPFPFPKSMQAYVDEMTDRRKQLEEETSEKLKNNENNENKENKESVKEENSSERSNSSPIEEEINKNKNDRI